MFVGIVDPDPRNNGAGIRILTAAGIEVSVGLLAEDVKRDLDPYLASKGNNPRQRTYFCFATLKTQKYTLLEGVMCPDFLVENREQYAV